MQNNILLVDMNSFFASVEQQANPFLRGRVIGVGNSTGPTSCLVGTSREAKALGIKNGISLAQARRICPEIIVLRAEPEKYREVCRRLNAIYRDYTDRVEAYSIDESFLEISNALQVSAEIKRRIRQEVGEWLTCSIGVASNKFLAKLASDMQKPDGLTMIYTSQLPEIYKTLKLSDLWGIGQGWTNRLVRLGIRTPNELMNYPVANLMAAFGKPGYYIWQRINGLETDRISDDKLQISNKSFGHSWVLSFRTTDKEKLKPVVLRLAEKAARRMRAENLSAHGIYLTIRLTSGECLGKSQRLSEPIDTGLEFYGHALRLWASWVFKAEVAHIACGFTFLSPRVRQLGLFNYPTRRYAAPSPERGGNGYLTRSVRQQLSLLSGETDPDKVGIERGSLTECLDSINNKYGEWTIRSGLITNGQDYAPDSIAFGK